MTPAPSIFPFVGARLAYPIIASCGICGNTTTSAPPKEATPSTSPRTAPAYTNSPRTDLLPQLPNRFPHLLRLGPVRMIFQELLQDIRRLALLPSPQINLRQHQLGMRKMPRIDLPRPIQMLHRQVQI